MNELTQWKDIYRVLCAVYESLLHEAVSKCSSLSDESVSFEEHFTMNMSTENTNYVSRFWYQTLYFINSYNVYFFAIRSGNFDLRNACLPTIPELFCAYFHNKYEQLSCETLYDKVTANEILLTHFRKGEWTKALVEGHFIMLP